MGYEPGGIAVSGPTDWRDAASAEYRAKRFDAERRLSSAERAVRKAQERFEAARKEIADLDAGARVFDLELIPFSKSPAPQARDDVPDAGDGPTAREIILEALEAAYPKPLRAGELKKIVEQRLGREIHYKTPGMTLYRLAEAGAVRRDGYSWYLNPPGPDVDHTQAPDQEDDGFDPDLLFEGYREDQMTGG